LGISDLRLAGQYYNNDNTESVFTLCFDRTSGKLLTKTQR